MRLLLFLIKRILSKTILKNTSFNYNNFGQNYFTSIKINLINIEIICLILEQNNFVKIIINVGSVCKQGAFFK